MRLPFILMVMLISTYVYGQNCESILYGKIIDLHDGSPLSGATIIVAGPETAVLSDLDGSFVVKDLCDQTYNLQVSHPECSTKSFTVRVSGNTTKTLRLEHHLEELNQITITGSTYTTKSETLFENRIDQQQIENNVSNSLGDVLNSLSGVSSLNTGNTVVKPVINGLHSSRVKIINNGVIMQDQEWGAEHAPNIDLNTAGQITVIKGASALQYAGDAVGGVVISETPKITITDTLFGKTILAGASNGRGGALTSTLTKSYANGWFGSIQGTIKRFGDFESPDYVLSNTGTFERALSARIGFNGITQGAEAYYSYFKNEIGILRASHLGGAEDQVAAISSDRPLIIRDFTHDINEPKQDVNHHLARLSFFKKFENLGKVSLQYDFQQNNRFEFDIRRGNDAEKPSVDLKLTSHNLALNLEGKMGEDVSFKTGSLFGYQENVANPNTGIRRLIPDYESYHVGLFGLAEYDLSEKILIEGGLRWDYTKLDVFKFYRTSFWESRNYDQLFPELVVEDFGDQILTNPQPDFSNFSGTLGALYRLSNTYNLFVNFSLASRAPNPSELYSEGLHQSASRIELGDLGFDSEIAKKIAITFQRKGDNWSFTLNPYVNFISDFLLIEPTGVQQTIRGNFQVWEYRQTQARLLGIDFDFESNLTDRLLFRHQFSLVKGQDETLDLPLINMPPANTVNEVIFKVPAFYDASFGLQSQYVFRQNEFPDTNFEVFIPTTQTTTEVDVSTPPDAYHLINLHSDFTFNLNSKSELRLGIDVNNLFNTTYRDYLNRLRYYADDLGRNISFNLKINY